VILPSLIPDEWERNFAKVRDETGDFVKACIRNSNYIIDCVNIVFQKAIAKDTVGQYKIEDMLETISRSVMEHGILCKAEDYIETKAYKRSIQNRAPAKEGKNSLGDCTIFEEVLEVGRLLRENGFTKRIVFSTSNTQDYYSASGVIDTIRGDAGLYGIEIVKSLDHGYHIVSSND
jgi:hypothetical protein